MTVGELIEQLQQEDPDLLVVMSSDAEGNCYSPMAKYWVGGYCAETTWYGEAYDIDEDHPEDSVPAIILKPIN